MRSIIQLSGLNSLSMKFLTTPIKEMIVKHGKSTYFENHWERQFSYRNSFVFPVDDDLKVICRRDSYISKKLFEGNFERQEIQFIKQFLRPDDIFIDIGANIGYHAIVAAHQLRSGSGKVMAFEPTPLTFRWMQENIALNELDNILAYPLAFSDKPGTFKLYQYQNGRDAYNSFGNILNGTPYTLVEVETTTLDHFIEKEKLAEEAVSLIKIDVEGWEYPVIKGGMEYLSRKEAPVLMVEFTDDNARRAGFSCQKIYDLVKELGYTWLEFQQGDLVPSKKRSYYDYRNLYATKNVDFVRQRLMFA